MLGIQSLSPVVSLAETALSVLVAQEDILQDGTTQQEYRQISEDGRMAGVEMWGVRTAIDIRRDNAVEVAPSDDDSEGDATLICACW